MFHAKRIMIWIVLTGLVLLLQAEVARAIPAFARRYNISCTTCHAPAPKLKPYGAEFAGNGFIMKENEKERDYINAGDDLLWLNKNFPLAVRFDAYAVHSDVEPAKNDLQAPWGLKLLSGGTLYKNIGYYFYFYMSERGEVAGIEDAYIHFDNIAGIPLDILVGQFQTSDPLMKRELRLTFEDYVIYKFKPGFSRVDLTYDRGVMFNYGVEKTGTDLFLTFTNGNGKGPADDDTKQFDVDNDKSIGVRLLQGFGDFLSLGGYFYTGRETSMSEEGAVTNKITYLGPDVNFIAGPLEVTIQYLMRQDTHPFFSSNEKESKTKGMVVEAVLAPQGDRSRFYLTALYNDVEVEKIRAYQTATLSGSYLLARNLRGVVEFTRDLDREQNRLVLGIVGAM